jgi:hypothetical protein
MQVRLLYRSPTRRLTTDTNLIRWPTLMSVTECLKEADVRWIGRRFAFRLRAGGDRPAGTTRVPAQATAACGDALQCVDTAFVLQRPNDTEATRFAETESLGKPGRTLRSGCAGTPLKTSAQAHSAIRPCDRRTPCLRKVLASIASDECNSLRFMSTTLTVEGRNSILEHLANDQRSASVPKYHEQCLWPRTCHQEQQADKGNEDPKPLCLQRFGTPSRGKGEPRIDFSQRS